MKKILILLLVVFSCFKLSFSQNIGYENIWKMPKDTSKFGKVIVKDQIVTFTDTLIIPYTTNFITIVIKATVVTSDCRISGIYLHK